VPLPAPSHDVLDFIARVAHGYATLIASPYADPESGLGGSLFYAGEMDEEGRALVVAANIAGAATLVASADLATQKQAIREAIADFLVTSLDEALRILKNQLRKRETVSVCVAMAPAAMEREMDERGVEPDLLRRDVPIAPLHEALIHQEGECDEPIPPAFRRSSSGAWTRRVTKIWQCWMRSLSNVSTRTTGRAAAGCASRRVTWAAWRKICVCSQLIANSPPASPNR
jgi:hypothetical protein